MLSRKEFLYQLTLGLAVAVAAAVGVVQAFASSGAGPAALAANVHTGTFVSAEGDAFTMQDEAGATHKHTLAADAKVTDPQGQPCKITDLKAGQKIEVTTKEDDATVATKVACVT